MIDADDSLPAPDETRRARVYPLRAALVITTMSTVVFAASMFALLRAQWSAIAAEFTAVVALGSFGVTVYGLLRTLLVLIGSAGERRRQARKVTERRNSDRARKLG
jgi:hypothetical protein